MKDKKLDMLKTLMTCAYEIEVKCSGEEISDCEFTLDDDSFEFVRDLVLNAELNKENPDD